MAVRDHINRVNKLRAQVITVDPSQRLIEVTTADGGLRRLSVYDVPSQFTWPLEGEEWSIYEENGYWYLGNKWLNPDESELFESMSPGDSRSPGLFKTKLTGGNQKTWVIRHHLNNLAPNVSITEAPKYFIFGKTASPTDTTLYNLVGAYTDPAVPGLIWCSSTRELIKYTTWVYDVPTGMNKYTGCTRGYGGTTPATHIGYSLSELSSVDFEKCWKPIEPIFPDFTYVLDENTILIELPNVLSTYDPNYLQLTVTG